jgi:dUTP pyrophosphatase
MLNFDFKPSIEVKILDPRLLKWGLPSYQTEMSAGIDLYACLEDDLHLEAGAPAVLVSAGISLLIGNPYIAATILPRSGMGHKKGLVLGNLVGLIDADYTGTIMVSAWNRNAIGTEPIVIKAGERIAQMVFAPIVRPSLKVVDEFSRTTERGDGGYGSTGVLSKQEGSRSSGKN